MSQSRGARATLFALLVAAIAAAVWICVRVSAPSDGAPQSRGSIPEEAARPRASASVAAASRTAIPSPVPGLSFRSPDGLPVPRVRLFALPSSLRETKRDAVERRGTESDAEGHLSLLAVALGNDERLTLAVAQGWRVTDVTSAARTAQAECRQVTVEMPPAIVIPVLRACNADGHPRPGIPFRLSAKPMPRELVADDPSHFVPAASEDAIHRGVSDTSGRVVFPHLPPGSYVLQTSRDWLILDEHDTLRLDHRTESPIDIRVAPVLAAVLDVHPPGESVAVLPHDGLLSVPSAAPLLMAARTDLLQQHPPYTVVVALGRDQFEHRSGIQAQLRLAGTPAAVARVTLLPPSRLTSPVRLEFSTPPAKHDERGSITVRVTDRTGRELQDVALSFIPRQKGLRAGAGMTSRATRLRPGRYAVKFLVNLAGPDYVLGEIEVVGGDSQVFEHQLAMSARSVHLRVVLRDGNSPPYALVMVRSTTGTSTIRSTQPHKIPLHVGTGEVELTVHVHGYQPTTVRATVSEGPWDQPVPIEALVQ